MEIPINKNTITTYVLAIVTWIFGTLGLSTYVTGTYAPLIATLISAFIAYVLSYYNEKYPSNFITPVIIDTEEETSTTEETDAL